MSDRQRPDDETVPGDGEAIVERVRERYASIAKRSERCCGGGTAVATVSERAGYTAGELDTVPDEADMGLGCGAPIARLDLRPGEVVLDLGSGGGLDALLAAERVGPTGRVIGVDMTPEMIERATENARRAGRPWVEFRSGRLEALPVEDASIDAVTSNCVINLVPDKSAVFREVARVLRPGGRLVVSDVVLDGTLPDQLAKDLLAYVGCIAGALPRERYFDELRAAGLVDVEVLADVDAVRLFGGDIPEEVRELVERTATPLDDLSGIVRSVTYRARRPA